MYSKMDYSAFEIVILISDLDSDVSHANCYGV